MKNTVRKLLSCLLVLTMVLSVFSVTVFADEAYGDYNGDHTDYPDVYPEDRIVDMTDEEIDEIVDAILNSMTKEEYYLMTGGSSASKSPRGYGTGFHAGIARLGVPVLRMYDGPMGVTSPSGYLTTKPSSEISLASSWSTELAYKFGEMNAWNNKGTAGNVQLGTQYDNARYPFYQRSRDSLGEDWYLTGKMGTQETKALQDNNVMATLKRYKLEGYDTTLP